MGGVGGGTDRVGADFNVHVHAQCCHPVFNIGDECPTVRETLDERGEDEAATDDHLLDIEENGVVLAEDAH